MSLLRSFASKANSIPGASAPGYITSPLPGLQYDRAGQRPINVVDSIQILHRDESKPTTSPRRGEVL